MSTSSERSQFGTFGEPSIELEYGHWCLNDGFAFSMCTQTSLQNYPMESIQIIGVLCQTTMCMMSELCTRRNNPHYTELTWKHRSVPWAPIKNLRTWCYHVTPASSANRPSRVVAVRLSDPLLAPKRQRPRQRSFRITILRKGSRCVYRLLADSKCQLISECRKENECSKSCLLRS